MDTIASSIQKVISGNVALKGFTYNMVKAKKFVLARRILGQPTVDDFELKEEDLLPIKNGEVLSEALVISVGPYMWRESDQLAVGDTMFGRQIARVIQSFNPNYKPGDMFVGRFGWRTHTICNPDTLISSLGSKDHKEPMPDMGKYPLSYGLGVLGMPGNTAYFGVTKICKPKPGETMVVSGAAGAVGSLAGQVAKIMGCNVIGFTGSDEKVDWLEQELKFDRAFNYKKTSVTDALKVAAPTGVDCYLDNVGGAMSSEVISNMNELGRVAVCGAVSTYHSIVTNNQVPDVPAIQPDVITKQLTVQGFSVHRWNDEWLEGLEQMRRWLDEGKLNGTDHVTYGFDNLPTAFIGMLNGENKGKAVVHV